MRFSIRTGLGKVLVMTAMAVGTTLTQSCINDVVLNEPKPEVQPTQTLMVKVDYPYDTSESKEAEDLDLMLFDHGGASINHIVRSKAEGRSSLFEVPYSKAGYYTVYGVANIPGLPEGLNENMLKNCMMEFTAESLPDPAALPMTGIATINVSGSQTVKLSLDVAAVRVRFYLIFDRNYLTSDFENMGVNIKSVYLENVPATAYIIQNQSVVNHKTITEPVIVDGVYFADFKESTDPATDLVLPKGKYSMLPPDFDKWVYIGETYIPESYIDNRGKTVKMNIVAEMIDKYGNYVRDLNYSVDNLAAYIENPQERCMPRGTYYEIVGRIKTTGSRAVSTPFTIRRKDLVYR